MNFYLFLPYEPLKWDAPSRGKDNDHLELSVGKTCPSLYDYFKGSGSAGDDTHFVTCFLIHYFFIWFFSRIRKQIFWQVNLKNSLSRSLPINSYLEPRMFYDVTDSGSFHGIDLEHLSDQVCYWRIFYMFGCFVNSSFNLKNKF